MSGSVLVTGGAGFIGSHLVDTLVASGARVRVLDNFTTGRKQNLAGHGPAQVEIMQGDILDAGVVESAVDGCSLVYHLAAMVGVRYIVGDPLTTVLTNVRGTEHVLAAAHRRGARVVFASTSEVYGRSEKIPFREDGDRVLGPTWIHRWSYSTAKALDEHLAFAYADRGLRVSVVRYFNSYGPRIDESGYGSVIARFASQALAGAPLTVHGDGRQTRCFTFVADTVRGTLLAGGRDEALGTVFNIGNAHEVSIGELAERVRDGLGSSSKITNVPYEAYYGASFQDTRRRVPDVSRARDVLGFEASISFEEGLAGTLAWCRENYVRGRT